MNRREFLSVAAAGAGILSMHPTLTGASTPPLRAASAVDRVTLGRSAIVSSFLAQGTGTGGGNHSSEQVRLGGKKFRRLIRHGLDQGINFIDAADLYGSHESLKPVLREVPRDGYTLLSKIWTTRAGWVKPSGGARAEVDRFRKELGVDHLDVCLIHCVDDRGWPAEHERVRDELSRLKEEGAVRAVGVSCHDFGALEAAADHPWVDVILARINHKGGADYWMDEAPDPVGAVLARARANGKGVVGMKLFGAGKIKDSGEMDASLRHVFGRDLVDAVTVGMVSPTEVDDTIRRINRALAG